ncbi:MAG: hypothetical protein KDI48_16335 [Xanthomonadales bacterium]|nr:hypothetical protein [Xanthomonadales bacterium]
MTASTVASASTSESSERYPWNYSGVRERVASIPSMTGQCAQTVAQPRLLLAGDSWAQFMWDDDTHNRLLDRFGLADRRAVSRSLGDNPGPGYTGPAYAVSGSEAREWIDTAQFPWIANVVSELQALPSIDTVLLSIGGNDLLAGRSDGGWYKDMDLDQAGAEAALFDRVLGDSQTIVDAFQAVRPELAIMVSSYEYPNFNVSALWCWIYACPKRRDLSRDPDNDLVSDSEINGLMLQVEQRRILWTNANPRLLYGHEIGAMHHYYGDGQVGPGVWPRPGLLPPDYQPFPAGNPALPSLRENFRTTAGISADPIHLDEEGYRYKVALQLEGQLYERLRGPIDLSLNSLGGTADGWTDGSAVGTGRISVGASADRLVHGLVSFDTAALPDDAQITAASLWLLLDQRQGSNPFTSGQLGAPRLDLARGSFGGPDIEASDATAPADASDVGCFVGSAANPDDALRIELSLEALAQIDRQGPTQFRLSFATPSTASARNDFASGDAGVARSFPVDTVDYVQQLQSDGTTPIVAVRGQALSHRGLVEYLGSARPVLTLQFTVDGLHSDGFED